MKKTTKTTMSQAPATPLAYPPKTAQKTAPAPRVLKPIKLAPSFSAAAAPQSPPSTVITAKVDVGFGNTLYIRGEGPGLSWNEGVPLDCAGSAEWTISLKGVQRPVAFKLLVNDEKWSAGENFTAEPGARATLTPAF